MTEIKIDNTQKIHVGVNPTNSTGTTVPVDGNVLFEVTGGDATVVADPDGKGAYLVSGENVGTSTVRVSADADLGEGVVTIEEIISLVVSHPQAAQLGLVLGAAEAK